MIPGLHEAHVRVFRCRRAAPWLATEEADFRIRHLKKVELKRGPWEAELLRNELEKILGQRRAVFASRMDVLRKAVFG